MFPVYRWSFSIHWRTGLVVLNFVYFCLSVKLLIFPSYLNEILDGYHNLGCMFFSFITLSMSCLSFLAWRVSIERLAVILMGMLFLAFLLLLLVFAFCVWSSLVWLICFLGSLSLGLSCLGLSGFLDLGGYFLPHFREVFNYYLLEYLLMAFLFVFFFWDSYGSNVGHLTLSQRSLRLSSFLAVIFFFFPLCFIDFHHSIFHLTYLIFCLSCSVGYLQSVFLCHVCISRYWLTLFYIF